MINKKGTEYKSYNKELLKEMVVVVVRFAIYAVLIILLGIGNYGNFK